MQLVWLPSAISDLQRLHDFLLPHNAVAAQRLVSLVKHAVHLLQTSPQIGKMADNLQEFRDIVIPFGASGYVLRYRLHSNSIFVIALRHCKEAGFRIS